MNNVGSTTLLHPVFINLQQVIIFRRVIEHDFKNSSIVIACATSCNANYSGSTHTRVQIDGLIYNKTHFRATYDLTS